MDRVALALSPLLIEDVQPSRQVFRSSPFLFLCWQSVHLKVCRQREEGEVKTCWRRFLFLLCTESSHRLFEGGLRGGILWTQTFKWRQQISTPWVEELSATSAENTELSKVISLKPGIGQKYSFACVAYRQKFRLSSVCLSSSITSLPLSRKKSSTLESTDMCRKHWLRLLVVFWWLVSAWYKFTVDGVQFKWFQETTGVFKQQALGQLECCPRYTQGTANKKISVG